MNDLSPRPEPTGSTERRVPSSPVTPSGLVPSERILQGQRSVAIEHNGSIYRLQATRQGKLILTK